MADSGAREIIAERVIPAKHEPTGRAVEVTLRCYAPSPDCGTAIGCDHEILFDSQSVYRMTIVGIDGFQAIMLSMKSLTHQALLLMRGSEITHPPEYTRDLAAIGDALRSAMKPGDAK